MSAPAVTRRPRRSAPSQNHSILQGLVGYWPLDDAAGATRKAGLWSPRATPATHLDLTDHATVAQVTGPNKSLPLAAGLTAASSMFLDVADNDLVSMPKTDVTLAAWVKLTSTPANVMGIVGQFNNASRGYYLRYNNATNNLEWLVNSSSLLTNTVKTTPGTTLWYHCVCRYSWLSARADSITNGFPNAAVVGTPGTSIVDSTSVFIIGNEEAGARFYDGAICHVGLWKRWLTNQEATWLYNNGEGRDLRSVGRG